jgi:hypothetical protein
LPRFVAFKRRPFPVRKPLKRDAILLSSRSG